MHPPTEGSDDAYRVEYTRWAAARDAERLGPRYVVDADGRSDVYVVVAGHTVGSFYFTDPARANEWARKLRPAFNDQVKVQHMIAAPTDF